MRSISSHVIVSGGISTTTSPSGRSSTPRCDRGRAHPPAPPQTRLPAARARRRPSGPAGGPRAPPGAARRARRAAARSSSERARTLASTSPRVEQLEVTERDRGTRARSRRTSGRGTASSPRGRGRGTRRTRGRSRPSRTCARYPAVSPLPSAMRSGRSPHCSRREQRAGAAEARRDLVADQQHVVLAARVPQTARTPRARRAACRPRPARAARRSRPRARRACVGHHALPRSRSSRDREKRGARSTGKRSGSNTSVPNPPSPTESAPMVSPWYAPPKARNVVRPATPWLVQYWKAIFRACSTALAPSDANRKCGCVDRDERCERFAQLDDDRLPLPSIVECAPRSSWSRTRVVELRDAVPERVDPQRRDGVEVAVAVDVDELVALGALDDDRRALGVRATSA